jgi:putative endonuclease
MWWTRKGRSLGARGEKVAVRYLRRAGYRILGRNVPLGPYEMDIVARQRDTIAFVEVKTRRDASFLAPEANVDYVKRKHIRAAAHRYIAQFGAPDTYYRFDIVSVVLPEHGKRSVTHYTDAFRDE